MKTNIKHFAAMLLMAVMLLVLCSAGLAEEETPMEETLPYRIVLTSPGGWNNSNSAVIKVSVKDLNNIGWYRIEYRMNEGEWIDCETLFNNGKAEIVVRENGTFTLRVIDPHGRQFEETTTVKTIDLAPPSVTAAINGTTLRIEIEDDLSGTAGVQVNSMLFTEPVNHVITVPLDDSMARFDKLSIRAFDLAGNFSEPIHMNNPVYKEPVQATPTPVNTSRPTKESASDTEKSDSAARQAVTEEIAPSGNSKRNGLGGSLIYVYDEPEPTAMPTLAPTPEPIIKTEYITIGPGMPYRSDGNSHTLDVLYSAATNKQFISLQSKNGNTFYLVIDYDKPIDEEAEMYETYFLNLVDEKDLLALMSDEEKEEVPTPTPEIIYVTPAPTTVPVPTAVPDVQEKSNEPDQTTAILALIAIAVLGAVGGFVFIKRKGNNKGHADNDFILDDDDDETE